MPLGDPNAPTDIAFATISDDTTLPWSAASVVRIVSTASGKKIKLPGDPAAVVPGAEPGRGSTQTGKVNPPAAQIVNLPDGHRPMRRGRVIIWNAGATSNNAQHDFVVDDYNIKNTTADVSVDKGKSAIFVYQDQYSMANDSKSTGYWIVERGEE